MPVESRGGRRVVSGIVRPVKLATACVIVNAIPSAANRNPPYRSKRRVKTLSKTEGRHAAQCGDEKEGDDNDDPGGFPRRVRAALQRHCGGATPDYLEWSRVSGLSSSPCTSSRPHSGAVISSFPGSVSTASE